MYILPAIDISEKKVVRLTEGDYNRVKVYSDNPVDMIKEFKAKGASYLHVVDLDGAKYGSLVNLDAISAIAAEGGIYIEVGGGIRDEEKIKTYLEKGASRVILGTVAIKNFEFTKEMAKKYGDKIAVGVDAKNGKVAVNGWLEDSGIDSVEFCKKLADAGVKTIIYTDISKDGMLSGCNLDIYKELCQIEGIDIVASGGVTSAAEVKKLKEYGCAGVIIGKAIYEGKITLEDALECAKG